jgi:hypothetical protein
VVLLDIARARSWCHPIVASSLAEIHHRVRGGSQMQGFQREAWRRGDGGKRQGKVRGRHRDGGVENLRERGVARRGRESGGEIEG